MGVDREPQGGRRSCAGTLERERGGRRLLTRGPGVSTSEGAGHWHGLKQARMSWADADSAHSPGRNLN